MFVKGQKVPQKHVIEPNGNLQWSSVERLSAGGVTVVKLQIL